MPAGAHGGDKLASAVAAVNPPVSDHPAATMPPGHAMSPRELQARINAASGRNVLVMLTDNTSSMLVIKPLQYGWTEVRAHHMFLDATPAVIREIGKWVRGRGCRRGIIRDFIEANGHRVREQAPARRLPVIRTQGRYFDLAEIRTHVSRTYLEGRSRARATWGRRVTRRRVSCVRLGTYDPCLRIITISRRLDRADIPRYMVEYVMFHEMLHEVLGIDERPDGRRNIHSRTFRFMEQTFPDYERALAFEARKWG